MPSSPISSATAASDTRDASAQPMPTPTMPAGIRIFRFGALYCLR